MNKIYDKVLEGNPYYTDKCNDDVYPYHRHDILYYSAIAKLSNIKFSRAHGSTFIGLKPIFRVIFGEIFQARCKVTFSPCEVRLNIEK